jgi:hypothetical protein
MAKYIPRTCPRCRDYLAVIVSPCPTNDREYDINGFCAVCGYEISLASGRRSEANNLSLRHENAPKP